MYDEWWQWKSHVAQIQSSSVSVYKFHLWFSAANRSKQVKLKWKWNDAPLTTKSHSPAKNHLQDNHAMWVLKLKHTGSILTYNVIHSQPVSPNIHDVWLTYCYMHKDLTCWLRFCSRQPSLPGVISAHRVCYRIGVWLGLGVQYSPLCLVSSVPLPFCRCCYTNSVSAVRITLPT